MNKVHKELLNRCTGFDWDKGNIDKNWLKHKVSPTESEQIFFNRPLIVQEDIHQSTTENRFYALGKTNLKRELFIAFTIRRKLIRIISARDMSRKEREIYNNE